MPSVSREELVAALRAHPECVHAGSPRGVSEVHDYIPLWAAAEVYERFRNTWNAASEPTPVPIREESVWLDTEFVGMPVVAYRLRTLLLGIFVFAAGVLAPMLPFIFAAMVTVAVFIVIFGFASLRD